MAVEHDFTTLDSCEDPSNWDYGGDAAAPALNSSEYVEGSGSLDLGKSGSSTTDFWYETKEYYDLSGGKTIAIQLYIADKDTLDKLSEVWVYVVDPNGNYAGWSVRNGLDKYNWHISDPLRVGWNLVRIGYLIVNYNYLFPPTDDSNGIPDMSSVKIKILFRVNDAGITIPSGRIKIDWLRSGGYIKFYGGTSANPYDNNKFFNDVDSVIKWGFIDSLGSGYVFFIKPTFTDYISLSNLVLVFNLVGYFTLTDDYAVGSISGSKFIANAEPAWQGRQNPLVKGSVEFSDCVFTRRGDVYSNALNVSSSGVSLPGSIVSGAASINVDLSRAAFYGFALALANNVRLTECTLYVDNIEPYYGASENTLVSPVIAKPIKIRASTAGEHKFVLQNPILFTDIDYDGSSGWFTVEYWFGIKARILDEADNPVANATVNIYDESSNLIGSTTTDSDGVMVDEILVLRRRAGKDSSGNVFDNRYKFKLEVVKDSTVYYSAWLEIDSRFMGTIRVYNAYTLSGWVSDDVIQVYEPIIIYARVTDWSGSPVSSLDVYADVKKPDNTVVTVSLSEDPGQPGTYWAEFDQTDLVGRYEAKIYAIIKGNTVETVDYFSVGRLEKKIDEIKDMIRRHDVKLDAYRWSMG